MENTVLDSRYELLERVGMGGMAVVYKAKDKMLNRFVAVKILREEFKENEDFIRRFKIESQAAASLSHQNIAQIYDVGEENGMNYIVMEYLEGETLKKYINSKDGKLSRREAVNFSMQICRALEHAHSKYVVHRDIKPQNIVITESGKLKLADFGIARAANNTTTVNTKGNVAVGSAHYLSPEQARGGYTDHRSDIYSFGVVMYEMFCGKLPFDAEESVSVVMQHLHEEPERPCDVNPNLPAGIEAIILKAMKKEQRLRYENASQILEDLILVYQNPSIDVSLLNASDSENKDAERIERSQNKTPRTPARRKRKKKSVSKALIAVIAIISALIISMAVLAFNILFPDTGEEIEVPSLVGMTFEEATLAASQASTEDVEFSVTESHREYSDEPKDTIIKQTPEGGGKVKSSRKIKVIISKGPIVIELEDYSGENYEKVEKKLSKLGLKVEIEEGDSDKDEGTIFKQNPQPGTKMAKGETVTLYVASQKEKTIVPKIVGMTKEDALILLDEHDLEAGEITDDDESELPLGKVSYQSVSENKRVVVGTKIDIRVSTGKKAEEPDKPDDPEKPENPEKPEDPDKPENPDTPDNPDTPVEPEPAQKKSVTISLPSLPKDRETVRVRLVLDGKTYYEKDFPTSEGTASVTLETDKALSLDVYYDGTYITTKEVAY